MKIRLLAALFFSFLSVISIFAESRSKEQLAEQAISIDFVESAEAIKNLRLMGNEGLDALFEKYSAEITKFAASGETDENWKRIAHALDTVAMQKDVYASKLYWHTDLKEAKKVAAEKNKPILSLRLLGNLNEEFSCANSRFFRAVLYPNSEISKYLRENYVLHWKSVRPAPKVTIDFGDGRKIERTLTGNSIHYVLDKDGTVVDALPGLNNPANFLQFLKSSQVMAQSNISVSRQAKTEKDIFYKNFRARQHSQLKQTISRAVSQAKIKFDTAKKPKRNYEEMPTGQNSIPSALPVLTMAVTKMMTEVNIVKDITPDVTRYGDEQINFAGWKKIVSAMASKTNLDVNSRAFIKRQTSKNNLTTGEYQQLISKLEYYIDIDTARNEVLMRPTLYVWLNKDFDKDVEKLNEKVYSELFLTPNDDEWLGLYSNDVYTALDGNGIFR